MKPVNKDMVITGQTLEFTRKEQTDAEGQQARRRFHTQVEAGAGAVNSGGLGTIPGVVEYVSDVGSMANGVRTACTACAHWDKRQWLQILAKSEGPLSKPEDRDTINAMRAKIMMSGYGILDDRGDLDVESTIRSFGVCRPLSEIIHGWVGKDPIHWPAVMAPDASCPSYVAAGANKDGQPNRAEIVTPAAPFGLFKPLDVDARKIGDKRRDTVLFEASGKVR